MKRILFCVLCGLWCGIPAFARSCDALASLALAHGKITVAVLEPAGSLAGLTEKPLENLPAFCRVAATLLPSSDSNIRIEAWMPAQGWNGKFEGTGNGGYAGAIGYEGLAASLRRGYAVATTDMGTAMGSERNPDVLIGHPERWQDWGSRSTHEMTLAAREIVRAYYGREPEYAYFVGCSTGGQQALLEAQRFPDDYDGIVAGAPANNRTRLHMTFVWYLMAAEATPGSALSPEKVSLVANTVLAACSAEKAVAADKFLSAPQQCQWAPEALLCKAGDKTDCLTAEQVTTVSKLYRGPVNPVTHAPIYPGLARGSESEWDSLMRQESRPNYDALFKWTFGPDWNWRTFDFNRDVAAVDAKLAAMLNATDANLQTFKAHGHKLIAYHGWADRTVPSLESINYYQNVENAQKIEAARHHRSKAEETQAFYRLFMIPGMAHCGGGPGLNGIDPLSSLEAWVEKGIAPDMMIAKRSENGVTEFARPVCPYPEAARYNRTGDAKDASSFTCSLPAPKGK